MEYYGKTTAELLDLWRQEEETVLTLIKTGEFKAEIYKSLAEREIHVLFNSPVPEDSDLSLYKLPIFIANGANINVQTKSLQFLDNCEISTSKEIY